MQRGKLLERDSELSEIHEIQICAPTKITTFPTWYTDPHSIRTRAAYDFSYGCWLPETLFVWLFVSFGWQAIGEKILYKNKTISFMS